MRRRWLVLAPLMALVACSGGPEKREPAVKGGTSESARPPVAAERAPAGKGADRPLPEAPAKPSLPAPAAPAVGRPKKAMEAHALNVAFRCASHDETHATAQADVEVSDGRVAYLRARLASPKGGVCEFALPDFTQQKRLPHVELKANRGRCTLRMWEQGPKVTLAYSDCADYCQPATAVDYILPILYDRRVNRCN